MCNAGKSQSPIDIPSKNIAEVNYTPFTFLGYDKELKDETLLNNGHTVQMGFGLHKGQMPPTVMLSFRIQSSKGVIHKIPSFRRSLVEAWKERMNLLSSICIGDQMINKDLSISWTL